MVDDRDLRLAVMNDLQDFLLKSDEVESFLQEVIDHAPVHVEETAVASITLDVHDHLMTVVSSDPSAWTADQTEYAAGTGPCVEAARRGTTCVVDDLEQDDRWPAWAHAAREVGFRSAVAVPAPTGHPTAHLALNLYSAKPHAFGDLPLERAHLYAQETVAALRVCLRLAEKELLIGQLQTALVSRSTIDQALGVIMGQNRCTRDEAFAVLRTASQHRNVKLRNVAAAVIENITGHPPADPHGFQAPS